jgi:diacylglycerol kinase family enzyme
VPYNIEKSIELILAGKTIKHDVGLVEYSENGRRKKRYFINIAGLGFDSMVLKKTNELKEKKRLAKASVLKKKKGEGTYIQTLLKTLLFYKSAPMRISIDDKEQISKTVFSMAVGIGRFNGNGMEQLPKAIVNDGLLDVNIIRSVSKVRILKNLSALFNGTIHEKKIVDMRQAKLVRVETDELTLVETDGELLGESPFEFTILPKVINVYSGLENN